MIRRARRRVAVRDSWERAGRGGGGGGGGGRRSCWMNKKKKKNTTRGGGGAKWRLLSDLNIYMYKRRRAETIAVGRPYQLYKPSFVIVFARRMTDRVSFRTDLSPTAGPRDDVISRRKRERSSVSRFVSARRSAETERRTSAKREKKVNASPRKLSRARRSDGVRTWCRGRTPEGR